MIKKTQLTQNEIGILSVLYKYSKVFGFTELEGLIEEFLRLRVSLKRKGRDEAVKIASASLVHEENMVKATGKMERRQNRG